MFHFSGWAAQPFGWAVRAYHPNRFPYSEISGSKVAKHLPEAYRSHATSFIASTTQDIHHLLLRMFYSAKHTIVLLFYFTTLLSSYLIFK